MPYKIKGQETRMSLLWLGYSILESVREWGVNRRNLTAFIPRMNILIF